MAWRDSRRRRRAGRYAIVDFAKCTEDQNGGLVALGPEGLDDRQAVAARQHSVDDQDFVVHARRHGVAGFAVRRVMRDVPGFVQRLDQVAGRFAVVFDQQDLHEPNLKNAKRQNKKTRPKTSSTRTRKKRRTKPKQQTSGSPMKRTLPSRWALI